MGPLVLLDATVSLLFVVGTLDIQLLPKVKRTRSRAYGRGDYELLLTMIPATASLVTTPHILAEVSNLVAQGLDGNRLDVLRERLGRHYEVIDERHIPAHAASQHPSFRRLGLTDAAIALLAEYERLSVITEDLDLWVHLTKVGVDAINFTHYRELR